ncbi:MAG: hypothetical protein WD066_01285 [Planctomycetaceae bacterium]
MKIQSLAGQQRREPQLREADERAGDAAETDRLAEGAGARLPIGERRPHALGASRVAPQRADALPPALAKPQLVQRARAAALGGNEPLPAERGQLFGTKPERAKQLFGGTAGGGGGGRRGDGGGVDGRSIHARRSKRYAVETR